MRQHLESLTPEEMREQGMFEFLFGPAPAQRELGGEMVAWLDGFVTAELLQKYNQAGAAGNFLAAHYAAQFARRVLSRRSAGGETARKDS